MFWKKKEATQPTHGVHIDLQIDNWEVRNFCKPENTEKLLSDTPPVIGKTHKLDTYNGIIQKAEATCISHSPEMWFHHGCSTFATTPNMRIDINDKLEELEFKRVDKWFSIETSYSKVCIFLAPIQHMLDIMHNGHLGYVGIEGVTSDVELPGDFPWLEGIHQQLSGGATNRERNGTTATYTNKAVRMRVNTIYEGAEHPYIST